MYTCLPKPSLSRRTNGDQSAEEGVDRPCGKNDQWRSVWLANTVGDRDDGRSHGVSSPPSAPVNGRFRSSRGPVGCVAPISEAVRVVQGFWRHCKGGEYKTVI